MKKQRKTYGVLGMMEYQAVIRVGRNYMKIPFSDGSLSGFGTSPAKFTTDNFMVQHAIENSAEYGRGLIRLINVTDIPGEVKVETGLRPEAPQAAGAPGDKRTPGEKQGGGEAPGEKQEDGETPEDKQEEPDRNGEECAKSLVQVEVTCNDDAKDYLEEKFGVIRSKLRNREVIMSIAESKGVEFVFV